MPRHLSLSVSAVPRFRIGSLATAGAVLAGMASANNKQGKMSLHPHGLLVLWSLFLISDGVNDRIIRIWSQMREVVVRVVWG